MNQKSNSKNYSEYSKRISTSFVSCDDHFYNDDNYIYSFTSKQINSSCLKNSSSEKLIVNRSQEIIPLTTKNIRSLKRGTINLSIYVTPKKLSTYGHSEKKSNFYSSHKSSSFTEDNLNDLIINNIKLMNTNKKQDVKKSAIYKDKSELENLNLSEEINSNEDGNNDNLNHLDVLKKSKCLKLNEKQLQDNRIHSDNNDNYNLTLSENKDMNSEEIRLIDEICDENQKDHKNRQKDESQVTKDDLNTNKSEKINNNEDVLQSIIVPDIKNEYSKTGSMNNLINQKRNDQVSFENKEDFVDNNSDGKVCNESEKINENKKVEDNIVSKKASKSGEVFNINKINNINTDNNDQAPITKRNTIQLRLDPNDKLFISNKSQDSKSFNDLLYSNAFSSGNIGSIKQNFNGNNMEIQNQSSNNFDLTLSSNEQNQINLYNNNSYNNLDNMINIRQNNIGSDTTNPKLKHFLNKKINNLKDEKFENTLKKVKEINKKDIFEDFKYLHNFGNTKSDNKEIYLNQLNQNLLFNSINSNHTTIKSNEDINKKSETIKFYEDDCKQTITSQSRLSKSNFNEEQRLKNEKEFRLKEERQNLEKESKNISDFITKVRVVNKVEMDDLFTRNKNQGGMRSINVSEEKPNDINHKIISNVNLNKYTLRTQPDQEENSKLKSFYSYLNNQHSKEEKHARNVENLSKTSFDYNMPQSKQSSLIYNNFSNNSLNNIKKDETEYKNFSKNKNSNSISFNNNELPNYFNDILEKILLPEKVRNSSKKEIFLTNKNLDNYIGKSIYKSQANNKLNVFENYENYYENTKRHSQLYKHDKDIKFTNNDLDKIDNVNELKNTHKEIKTNIVSNFKDKQCNKTLKDTYGDQYHDVIAKLSYNKINEEDLKNLKKINSISKNINEIVTTMRELANKKENNVSNNSKSNIDKKDANRKNLKDKNSIYNSNMVKTDNISSKKEIALKFTSVNRKSKLNDCFLNMFIK